MKKAYISLLVICSLFLFANIVFAEDNQLKAPLEKLGTALLGIVAALAVLMIVISAFYFLFSGGDPEKVKKARDVILYAIIGLLVAALAGAIFTLINNAIK